MSDIIIPKQLEYLKELRTEENELTLEMEVFAKEKKIPILEWTSAEFIEQIVLIQKPKRVLELGTAIAYTSIRIARILGDKGKIDTIEISKHNIPLAKAYIKRSKLGKKINLIEGNAFDVLPSLKNKYDMIYIDADKEDYEALFDLSMKLLKKGGVMIVDNLLWHGCPASEHVPSKYKTSTAHVRKFNKIFLSHPQLKTTILTVGDGIGIGVKK